MRELVADLFVSLDGFAGGNDVGAFFGYPGPELDGWVRRHLDEPQVLLMGRVTYEALARLSASAPDAASGTMTALPKLVVSRTLSAATWGETRILRGDIAEEIGRIKRQPGPPLRSIGSVSLVRSLVRLGLVDRLRLTVFPLTLGGDGREPVFADFPRARFELAGTSVLDGRLVVLDYRAGPAGG